MKQVRGVLSYNSSSLKGNNNSTKTTTIKIVPKLLDKPIEEQIYRCVQRMKSYPNTIDTIYRALSTLLKDVNNIKYRTIDTTSTTYQRTIGTIPGAEMLFRTIHYRISNNDGKKYLVLDRSMVQPQIIEKALSELRNVQHTSQEYKQAKDVINFNKEIRSIIEQQQQVDPRSDEGKQKTYYLSLCPPDRSTAGVGSVIKIIIGDAGTNTSTYKYDEPLIPSSTLTVGVATISSHPIVLSRKFDSDDTVQDVLYWLGSIGGTILYDKLLSNEWKIIDWSDPKSSINCSLPSVRRLTLQAIGFWPTGKLSIRHNNGYNAVNSTTADPSYSTINNNNNRWEVSRRALGVSTAA